MITSTSNELIKRFNRLKDKKFSRLEKLCVVESVKLVRELYQKKLTQTIFLSESKVHLKSEFEGQNLETVSENVAKYMSETVTNDGLFAICKIPNNTDINYSKCLVLDRIQDPSNLGAIIRSAKAFGFDTIFAVESVYPYSYKVIRSSMGCVFKVNIIDTDLDALKTIKENKKIYFFMSDMDGKNIDNITRPEGNICVVIGNEGQGVSDSLAKICDETICIPMEKDIESLNASVSAGIIMYKFK